MSQPTKVFITGATGYLGGSIISNLLAHPAASKLEITALVRTEAKAEKLRQLGLKTVIGSYSPADFALLTQAAADADIVFETASDNMEAEKAILKGIKARFEATGKAPILIQTTGTVIVSDLEAKGETSEHRHYSDVKDAEALVSLPPVPFHKAVDNLLIEADTEGWVKVFLVAPSAVYGKATGIVADTGVQQVIPISVDLPTKVAFATGGGRVFSKGVNHWPYVDIHDVADFYVLLLDTLISPEADKAGHGKEGYYFLDAFHLSAHDLAKMTLDEFIKAGVASPTSVVQPFTEGERAPYGPYWVIFGSNCYAYGDRARALGWKPQDVDTGKAALATNVKEIVASIVSEFKAT